MSDSLETRLATLDASALAGLLRKRAGSDEDFRLWLAAQLAAGDAREQGTPLDPAPFRQRAEALLEPALTLQHRGHWDGPHSDIDEAALEELLGEAQPFLDAGDGNNALAILRPVAAALADYWPQCAEWDETLHEFFPVLDAMTAQAVLLDGISPEARDDLADDLTHWQSEVEDHGASEAFAISIAAATQGWDEPGLAEVLDGRASTWPIEDSGDWLEVQLTTARLAALEAMGRTQQFINLARATGRHGDQAVMLIKRERFDEALVLAHSHCHDADTILRLVQALHNKHQLDRALELANWGLWLPAKSAEDGWRRRHALACWLREAAQDTERSDLAVTAGQAAFEESLSREDFRSVKTLCSPQELPALREILLKKLMDAPYAPDRIDILLDEGRIEDAMAIIDRDGDSFHSRHDPALMRLAMAASVQHPAWTIRMAWRMANPIIEEGRSKRYEIAVQWLDLAAQAHAQAATTKAWRADLDTLIQTHGRKRNLRALLERLRVREYP